MANFIVTFHIKSDATYSERYNSFKSKINELCEYKHWDETTSFYCFESEMSADDLCTALWVGSKFSAITDMMVVIDVSNRSRAVKGPLEYPGLLEKYLGF